MAGGLENDVSVSSKPPPKQTKWQGFVEFLYDKKSGKVLGRTPSSWGQITLFYIVLYAFLTAFFAACLAAFLATLDDDKPKWTGKGTIIGIYPGMGYQPWLNSTPESTLIHFNKNDPDSYANYTKQIQSYIDARYVNTTSTRECTDKESNADPEAFPSKACRFNPDMVYNTNVKAKNDANYNCKPPHFGFDVGEPCIIVTLNRLIDWRPIPYPSGSEPDVLKDSKGATRADQFGSIAIHCVGEYYADQDNIGEIAYIPRSGLNWRYYPYRRFENYHQPFAFVKFIRPSIGQLIEVECHAYAYNILRDQTDRLGMVHFELLVDDAKMKKNP